MSISTKFKKYKKLLSANCIVYQPGRVGSTAVTKAMSSVLGNENVVHLHSAGFDRVYCMKRPTFYRTINAILARCLGLLLLTKKVITGKSTIVLVPLRDAESRNHSVFLSYFELLVAEARKMPWYRSYFQSDSTIFLNKVFDETVEKNGINLWLKHDLQPFLGGHLRLSITPSIEYKKIDRFWAKCYIFNITESNSILDKEFNVKKPMDQKENTGKRKWCYDFVAMMDNYK